MACGRSFLFVFSFLHRRSFRVVASMKSAYDEEEDDSEEVSPDDDSDDDVTTVFKTFVNDNASSFFTNI